jgi:hypothetical protein
MKLGAVCLHLRRDLGFAVSTMNATAKCSARINDTCIVLYIILIEFRITLELIMPIKMCLREMYSRVCTGKYIHYVNFPN